MESYFLLPEGGDLSEMGTSVGPNMLERYPIFLQPEPVLGDPAQLILNSPPPPPPPAPSFAAPPAVRFQPSPAPITPSGYAEMPVDPMSYYEGLTAPELSNVQTFTRPRVEQTAFGPVTSSGYAEPPVDSMGYYYGPTEPELSNVSTVTRPPAFGPVTSSGYAEPMPSPESYYGGDIQPELSNVSTVTRQPVQQPAAPASPKQTGGGGQAKTQSTATKDEFPDYPGYKLGDLVPNMGGIRVGDYFENNLGQVYNWRTGEWSPAPTPPEGGVEELTPEQVTNLLEGQTPTTSTGTTGAPGTGSPTPGTSTPDLLPTSPTVVPQFTITPPTYFEPEKPDGYFPIDRTSQPSTPRPVRGIDYTPLNPLRTVPLPQRATDNFVPEPYNTPNYIQYDPDEILAAAMRAIGNQRIRQSIVDQAMENRMLERMRG